MTAVKLFKNSKKPYRLLGKEDNGDVIWAQTVEDKSEFAGNRIPKEDFNDMLKSGGWESDDTTSFTYVDGKFRSKTNRNDSL